MYLTLKFEGYGGFPKLEVPLGGVINVIYRL